MDVARGELRVDAARVAGMRLDSECVLERAQVASAAGAQAMPFLGAEGRYNADWAADAVGLAHNAARHVLRALLGATAAFHALALDVTARDVALYARLLRGGAAFLAALLAVEEPALYAEAAPPAPRRRSRAGRGALEVAPGLPPELAPAARAATRQALLDAAAELRQTARDAPAAPALATARAARAQLLRFAGGAQRYFRAKERALPRVLARRLRSATAKTRIEGRTLDALLREDGGMLCAAMLVCALGCDDVVAEFARRNFARDAAKRARFLRARRRLQEGFLQIPVVFEQAAQKYAARFSVDQFVRQYGKGRPRDEVLALVGQ